MLRSIRPIAALTAGDIDSGCTEVFIENTKREPIALEMSL
jgi:hypothetical protein